MRVHAPLITRSTPAALTVDDGMVRAELERIEARTLVLWGDQDRMIPRGLVDGLMELHPAWVFRAVDGIGQLLPWETPQCMSSSLQTGWAAGPNAPWAALRHRTTRWTPVPVKVDKGSRIGKTLTLELTPARSDARRLPSSRR